MSFFHTLYGKLAAAFLVAITVIGLLFFSAVWFATTQYQQEVNQKLNYALAQHIVDEESLFTGADVNHASLKKLFHMLMVINPSIELYLLSPQGRILAYDAPEEKIQRRKISMVPVKQYLSHRNKYPIHGDDPRSLTRQKVFSAAPVGTDGAIQGYLYIILGSEEYDSMVEMLQQSYIVRVTTWGGAVALGITLVMGLSLFFLITKRLRRLDHAVQQYGVRLSGTLPPLVDSGRDEISRLTKSFQNMSARIESQHETIRQNEQSRRDLIANVSHDIRTPLASLNAYLETIVLKFDQLDKEKILNYIQIGHGQARQLIKLTDQLFEYAKLDTPQDIVCDEPFSLAELIADVCQKYTVLAQRKNIQMQYKIENAGPLVHGDIGMLERVLSNLIDNAIEYTPSGGKIELSLIPEKGKVKVSVRDNGVGIPRADQANIFERYHRGEQRRGEQQGKHAGLGLAIARKIIQLHGGDIQVESRFQSGTVVSFYMPAAGVGQH